MNKNLALIALALAPFAAVGQVIPPANAPATLTPTAPVTAPAPGPALTPPAGQVNTARPTVYTTDQTAAAYFTNPNPALSPQDRQAIAIGQRWQEDKSTGMMPTAGQDGSIRFVFGASEPTIVCAVLQVCDVALQGGEQVNSINLGDTARWTVEPAVTGSGPSEVQHLIIKPQDVGLNTSLVVTTDRRTYHFRLLSHRTEFMPFVSFVYPEDAMAKWAAIRKAEVQEKQVNTIPATGEYLGNLNFNYTIEGHTNWTPVRVYNDGVKTIIDMPYSMSQTDAPTLLVVRKINGHFKDKDQEMVNYRVQGDRYIVDNVFDRAILISGVGHDQARVIITRGQ
jgi:P-type conjugative transfer protein TrbG